MTELAPICEGLSLKKVVPGSKCALEGVFIGQIFVWLASLAQIYDIDRLGQVYKSRLRKTLLPAYFRFSSPLMHVRKVVGGFVKNVVLVVKYWCKNVRKQMCAVI